MCFVTKITISVPEKKLGKSVDFGEVRNFKLGGLIFGLLDMYLYVSISLPVCSSFV